MIRARPCSAAHRPANVGINRDRAFQLVHRVLFATQRMIQVGEMIVQRRLPVTVPCPGDEFQRPLRQFQCPRLVMRRVIHQRQIV